MPLLMQNFLLDTEWLVSNIDSNSRLSDEGMVSDNIDLISRLNYFGFTAEDLSVARHIWEIIEDEAASLSELQFEKWHAMQTRSAAPDATQRAVAIQAMTYDLRVKFTRFDDLEWVRAVEKVVIGAFSSGIPLTGLLSIGSAYAAM